MRRTPFDAVKTNITVSTAQTRRGPVETKPAEKSATIASGGNSPKEGRPAGAQSSTAAHRQRGRATSRASDETAAAKGRANRALTAVAAEAHSAP